MTQTAGSSAQPFGYTGEQRDAATELVYLRARMYDPQSGRFIQRDTFSGRVEQPASLNRYSYVLNNPVNSTDPTGHDCTETGDATCMGGGDGLGGGAFGGGGGRGGGRMPPPPQPPAGPQSERARKAMEYQERLAEQRSASEIRAREIGLGFFPDVVHWARANGWKLATELADRHRTVAAEIRQGMQRALRINFELRGVNMNDTAYEMRDGEPFYPGTGRRAFTNYELDIINSDEQMFAKTVWYYSGVALPGYDPWSP